MNIPMARSIKQQKSRKTITDEYRRVTGEYRRIKDEQRRVETINISAVLQKKEFLRRYIPALKIFKKFQRIYLWWSPSLEKHSTTDVFRICERLPKMVNIVLNLKGF